VEDREATSSPAGRAQDVWIDGRYVAPVGSWDAQPRIGARATWYRIGDWQEAGAGALSLLGFARTTTSVQAEVAMRVSRAVGGLRPFVEGRYQRELSAPAATSSVALTDRPGGQFLVNGVALARGAAAGLGGVTWVGDSFGVSLLYELWHSRTQTRQTLQLGVGF
jgi:hypothetical protein